MGPQARRETRRRIRFEPDPLAVATIDFGTDTEADFRPTISALILDEAPLGGCGLVAKCFDKLAPDLCVRVKVGEMAPLHAVVRSVKSLDFNLVRIGLEFIE